MSSWLPMGSVLILGSDLLAKCQTSFNQNISSFEQYDTTSIVAGPLHHLHMGVNSDDPV
jgi:hypothetical protein